MKIENGIFINLPSAHFAFAMCAGVAVSTTRGLLIAASSKSKISNALLPLIDANSFFPAQNSTIEVLQTEK